MSLRNIIHSKKSDTVKFQPIDYIKQQMDDLVDNFFSNSDAVSLFQPVGLFPSLDISETDKETIILAELPGVKEKDVKIESSGHQLTISGEKKDEYEEGSRKSNYYVKELSYGNFSRSFSLPFELDQNKIKASFSKGILTIKVEKPAEFKPSVTVIPISHKD